jgi:F420 biosynthesis protein FbiB-like protein
MEHMLIQSPTSPLVELVRERRSIRAFQDRPVARELVAEILRESLWAPSPHNSQPWRFTILFDFPEKDRLARAMAQQLSTELVADSVPDDVVVRQTERSRGRISTAPVVILCSLVRAGLAVYPDERRNHLEFQMAVQSVGSILQTVFLLAQAQGLGSCWMAAPMYCPEVVRDALALPVEFEPQALTLLGYPAKAGKIRERRPLEDMVELR